MPFQLPCFDRCILEGPEPKLDGTMPLLVGFSARNRAFNSEFFRRVVSLAELSFSRLIIVVVDIPYAFNDAAKRGANLPDSVDIEKAIKVGNERCRMVENILHDARCQNYSITRWQDWSTVNSIEQLRLELLDAVKKQTKVYNALREYTKIWKKEVETDDADLFQGFLIEEFPVFVHLYYELGYLVDIYPGRNFAFFHQIESGLWADELPRATRLAAKKRLSFLNVGYANV